MTLTEALLVRIHEQLEKVPPRSLPDLNVTALRLEAARVLEEQGRIIQKQINHRIKAVQDGKRK